MTIHIHFHSVFNILWALKTPAIPMAHTHTPATPIAYIHTHTPATPIAYIHTPAIPTVHTHQPHQLSTHTSHTNCPHTSATPTVHTHQPHQLAIHISHYSVRNKNHQQKPETKGGCMYRHKLMGGIMKYGVDMGSGVMIYVHTKFHKDWFRHSEVDMGGYTDTHTHRMEIA
jgi:hypothetical protein